MKTEEQIDLKIGPQNSNPAKNSVLEGANDNVLNAYLKEIANYPQLSAKEEKELAKRIEQGDLEAKQKLIQSNLKLVITIAKKVIHTAHLPLVDLIQEGNLGLMIASEKFNYRLGYRFSTYATWWVKQSMFKAISEQGYCMKIPVYIQETLSKYSKIKSQMEQEQNGNVTIEEVAKKMNTTSDKINLFLSAYNKTISIENNLKRNDGKEMKVADILTDEKSFVSENIELQYLQSDLENIISSALKEREQEVVRMRYGLNNTEKFTLEEIGNIYGVTKESIRQTEIRALRKMKLSGAKYLECYIY